MENNIENKTSRKGIENLYNYISYFEMLRKRINMLRF